MSDFVGGEDVCLGLLSKKKIIYHHVQPEMFLVNI